MHSRHRLFIVVALFGAIAGCGLYRPRLGSSEYPVQFPAIPTHVVKTVNGARVDGYSLSHQHFFYTASVRRAPSRVHLDETEVMHALAGLQQLDFTILSL